MKKTKKINIEEKIILKYYKSKFTMQNAVEDVKSKYLPCVISINDMDDQEYHIVTLTKL